MSLATQTFILPRDLPREGLVARVSTVLGGLSPEKAWRVSITEHKPSRSHQQNKYLWSMYTEILSYGGDLEGWTKEDLHEFFLGSHFGWEKLEGFGRTRLKPLRRSSALNKLEFMDFIGFIQQFMAERGVYIADPHEVENGSPEAVA
jgi:hypothetical protein